MAGLFVLLCLGVADSPDGAAREPSLKSSDAVIALTDWLATPRERRGEVAEQAFATIPLTKTEAARVRSMLWSDHADHIMETRAQEWEAKEIRLGEYTMRFKSRHFGEKPKDGWSLYISLHGGGGVEARVNDQQWSNQVNLYELEEGLVVSPRAPTNNWNLWHEPHIDPFFDRLISDAIVLADVNPDRVYVMGYSAGGDGVYQLAPRMADRWAGAAMMAGHPNDASPLGLRNIAFAAHVGALDDGYQRNEKLVEWGRKLKTLRQADPQGYRHVVRLHEGRGHWMNLEEKVGVEWIGGFTRDPLPDKVVWMQSNVTHDRFYWLAVPPESARGGDLVIVRREGQRFEIEKAEGVEELVVRLSDGMEGLNLDRDVVITRQGAATPLFKGRVHRTVSTIAKTLAERGDPRLLFDAEVAVQLGDR